MVIRGLAVRFRKFAGFFLGVKYPWSGSKGVGAGGSQGPTVKVGVWKLFPGEGRSGTFS